MHRRLIVAVLLCITIISPSFADNSFTLTENIPYIEDGHERHVLDLYLPSTDITVPYPVMFIVHGGGFFFGDSDSVSNIARRYADLGYAVVAPNYRLFPDARFPDSQADVFCAMAWTFAQSDTYGFDTSEIILMGESAGANITAYLGAVDDATDFMTEDCVYDYPENPDYDAVISLYMPVDLLSCDCTMARRMASLYTGISYQDWDDENAIEDHFDISVVSWLDANDPPFYLLHGDIDFLVPISEAELFVENVNAVGGRVELVVFEGANHGFLTGAPQSEFIDRSWTIIDDWIGLQSS